MWCVIRRLTIFPTLVIGSPVLYLIWGSFVGHKEAIVMIKYALKRALIGIYKF